jgi:acetoin utilization protein AcuC
MLTQLAGAYSPDVIVTQLGADTHWGDPLANLGLTMPAYPRMAEILHDVVHEHAGGRWVATGGGGYQADTIVPKVWTIHFARMAGRPEVIPPEWLADRDDAEVSRPNRDDVEGRVESVLAACVPRLAALASA